jgi:CAAX prenyl protease-like protein
MPPPQAMARCMPFAIFITILGVQTIYPAPWLVVARSLVFVPMALIWFWPRYVELTAPTCVRSAHWALAVGTGLAIFGVWTILDHDWIVMGRGEGFDPRGNDGSIEWPMAIARLAGLATIVPIMEELFWRSFVLRWLEHHDFLAVAPRQVGPRAFAITTVLFALEHNQWLAGAIAGAAYNWLYIRSGSLWVPIAAHAITNAALGLWILRTGNWAFW